MCVTDITQVSLHLLGYLNMVTTVCLRGSLLCLFMGHITVCDLNSFLIMDINAHCDLLYFKMLNGLYFHACSPFMAACLAMLAARCSRSGNVDLFVAQSTTSVQTRISRQLMDCDALSFGASLNE